MPKLTPTKEDITILQTIDDEYFASDCYLSEIVAQHDFDKKDVMRLAEDGYLSALENGDDYLIHLTQKGDEVIFNESGGF